jgi:hypothetical protein
MTGASKTDRPVVLGIAANATDKSAVGGGRSWCCTWPTGF